MKLRDIARWLARTPAQDPPEPELPDEHYRMLMRAQLHGKLPVRLLDPNRQLVAQMDVPVQQKRHWLTLETTWPVHQTCAVAYAETLLPGIGWKESRLQQTYHMMNGDMFNLRLQYDVRDQWACST